MKQTFELFLFIKCKYQQFTKNSFVKWLKRNRIYTRSAKSSYKSSTDKVDFDVDDDYLCTSSPHMKRQRMQKKIEVIHTGWHFDIDHMYILDIDREKVNKKITSRD